ncbi:hypothetical protein EVAR_59964_1 [Eumeta japonica]|uniref:Uncharacterized protein n=1 Tax=Eumeta variegata TaxID=151549 RepID=A0A4C1YXB9_EUMVA|nr:hypothetical protein EVAR_59964_1 [Eumeta japonica]
MEVIKKKLDISDTVRRSAVRLAARDVTACRPDAQLSLLENEASDGPTSAEQLSVGLLLGRWLLSILDWARPFDLKKSGQTKAAVHAYLSRTYN